MPLLGMLLVVTLFVLNFLQKFPKLPSMITLFIWLQYSLFRVFCYRIHSCRIRLKDLYASSVFISSVA